MARQVEAFTGRPSLVTATPKHPPNATGGAHPIENPLLAEGKFLFSPKLIDEDLQTTLPIALHSAYPSSNRGAGSQDLLKGQGDDGQAGPRARQGCFMARLLRAGRGGRCFQVFVVFQPSAGPRFETRKG